MLKKLDYLILSRVVSSLENEPFNPINSRYR